ncbi:hypothetical protein Tco_1346835 [Tanacetum coccineum]
MEKRHVVEYNGQGTIGPELRSKVETGAVGQRSGGVCQAEVEWEVVNGRLTESELEDRKLSGYEGPFWCWSEKLCEKVSRWLAGEGGGGRRALLNHGEGHLVNDQHCLYGQNVDMKNKTSSAFKNLRSNNGLTDMKNLATACMWKEKDRVNCLNHKKDGREIFGMPITDALLTDEIKGAPYYGDYQEHVAKYQQFLDEKCCKAEKGGATESSKPTKVTKPKAAKATKPCWALELSLIKQGAQTQGPARPVVIREPESGRIQPLPEKCPPKPTKSSAHTKSPSMEAELNLTDSETESDEEASKINVGNQEGQAGPNPGIAAESQLQTSHVVHAGPNLERMDLGTSDASTQQKPEQMDEEFTTTAYPNVQENLKLPTEDQVILEEPASSTGTLSSLQNLDKDLSFSDKFFVEKPHKKESGKTNAETEVQSMVSVPIHQDTSSVPPMTTLVIDLTTMQSDSPLPTSTATTSIITTTIAIPPTPQPQQSTTYSILVSRIGELEQHMVDLIQNNLALEERLDKHGTRLYNLENLNISHKVSQAVNEIVIDAVD